MATETNQTAFWDGFYKLLKKEWEVDVRLKAGDSDDSAAISVHKLVLAARSQVFENMLESDEFKASTKLETITLSEMKHEEVKVLVEFMYSVDGSISLEDLEEHGRSLYLAADKYDIPHLKDICRSHFIYSLNSSNALDILEFAQIPFDKALNNAAIAAMKTNIREIASSGKLELFVVNHPDLAVEIMKTPRRVTKEGFNGSAGIHSGLTSRKRFRNIPGMFW